VTLWLTAHTAGEVAREVGVTERTLRRWRGQPAFVDAVRLAARDEHRDATAGLLAAQRRAVRVLADALDDPSPYVRLRAAVTLLDHGRHAAGDDVDERLSRVEEVLAGWHDETPCADSPPLRTA